VITIMVAIVVMIAIVMVVDILLVVPVILHEIDWPPAGMVSAAVLLPVFFLARTHVQIHGCWSWKLRECATGAGAATPVLRYRLYMRQLPKAASSELAC
jgi:uncharacterized RDD family membrane protein YckC